MSRKLLIPLLAAVTLGACTTTGPAPTVLNAAPAVIPKATPTRQALQELPAPERKVAIAVYGFTDQTGQYKPSETGQTLSRAVTQGGASILIKALRDTGSGSWFTVVERERLDNLLRERQIIAEMRLRYLGETQVNPEALPAMLFAGVLLEGGIVGYDTNTKSGGVGAALLGIGASSQYRQDTVTVYLRAVSVRSGEVLGSVTASKTILSQAVSATAFRYVDYKELLESEIGYTTNEPDQIALEQAIQKALYALIMEGVETSIWKFQDTAAGHPHLWRYQQERAGILTPAQVEMAREQERRAASQGKSDRTTAAAPKPVAAAEPARLDVPAIDPKLAIVRPRQANAALAPNASAKAPPGALPPTQAAQRGG